MQLANELNGMLLLLDAQLPTAMTALLPSRDIEFWLETYS